MFTGRIESVATVARISRSGGGARLGVTGIRWPHGDSPKHGDSIAVNGVCLTAIDPHEGDFDADLSPETLRHSVFGELRSGDRVNLERALRPGDRLRLGRHAATLQLAADGASTWTEMSAVGPIEETPG